MKNFTTLLVALFFFVSASSTLLIPQQVGGEDRAWSIVTIDPNAPKKVEDPNTWIPVDPNTSYYDFGTGITVGPNFRVKPSSSTTQSELSIDVHPLNSDIVFGSANATNNPVTQLYGTGVYWSLDGSTTWTGFDQPPFGSNSGDPVSVIGTDGRFYENYITNSLGQGVAVSTNNGVNWTTHVVAPNPGSLADKNHYMVDKTVGSPYENRSYCSWLDFGGPYDGEVVLRYSTNFGQTWTPSINISGALTPLGSAFAQGTNVQTGPNGEVYVVYAIYDANWTDGEDAMGFSKSTDGGVTWTHQRIYESVNFGIRGNLSSKNGIRVSSFPSMAVDRSGGSTNGNIYVCWPQRGTAPAGSDPDIVLVKSTDGGTTWTSPIRVNDDAMNNGKDQYFPWSTVDQTTGQLMLIFYDSRDVPNNQADVYMARSFDGGNTFENFKVSDQPHTPSPIPGLAGGYAGDYIGVAALDDVAYPFWADNRTGNYQAWTALVEFGPPCPVDPPSNPSPANGATAVSINLPEISWANGVGATQVEVWFGEAGSMTQVYSGSLISSWSIPAALEYNTMYNWRIVGKNDTCDVSGPIWAFTTELSPGVVFIEPFDNLSCWTPIGPLGLSNWSSAGSSNAGGTSPELQVSWTPSFNGLSKLLSCSITTPAPNVEHNLSLKHFCDWYADPAPFMGIGVSYDAGANYTTLWDFQPVGGNVGPEVVNLTFTPTATNFQLVLFLNGDSFNIDYWYVDDILVDYVIPVELTSFTASSVNNEVTLNWSTATETNNQGFEVEKLANGIFEKVGYVAGFGTTTEPKSYSFTDTKLEAGEYTYRLKQIDFDGTFTYTDEVNVEVEIPLEYTLDQNYPNPFNPSTTIKYSLADDGMVKLAVYNMLGEEVATIVNSVQKAGRYEVSFDASNLSSGVYVYRLETANYTSSKKLMLMK